MSKSIVVTGANGQVGRSLLAMKPDRMAASGLSIVFAKREDLDIADLAQVTSFCGSADASVIINCAAFTAVEEAERNRQAAWSANVVGPKNLATVARDRGAFLIHLSTDYVFDGKKRVPYREDAPTSPLSAYGESKRAGEEEVINTLRDDSLIIRASWIFSSFGANFLKTILRLSAEKDEIGVVDDQFGTPVHAIELSRVIWRLVELRASQQSNVLPSLLHYGSGEVVSWFDFACEIVKAANRSCRVRRLASEEYPTAAERPAFSVLDGSRLAAILNYEYSDWRDGVSRCIEDWQGC